MNKEKRYKKALEVISQKKCFGNSFAWSEMQGIADYALGNISRADLLKQTWPPKEEILDRIDNSEES